ncbi:SH3 domain-containing protein [Actinacidiphila acidipaludis]|uniref:SH3 domain-containing protein n=1 Tax=Actinacidiphila acidipaludis TaxID=2873382 RepID=A0ABS7QEH2_9ACTN|nr:SH3 domain-containing protein [Streptomyces acidipaludis]MBY8881575.1 SH3 domain-containing protein [Streptomyces acidipaludis]
MKKSAAIRKLPVAVAIAFVVAAVTVPQASAAQARPVAGALSGVATPASFACGSAAPVDHDPSPLKATGGGANIRSGSSTGCAIRGTADAGHKLNYYCWTLGSDNASWTYLKDQTTGVQGWVYDQLLSDHGSSLYCA